MADAITFADFRNQWLEEVMADAPTATEVRQRFARKLFTQWRDIEASDEVLSSEELSQIGIDLAYFEAGRADDNAISADTWYLVTSYYTGAFQMFAVNSLLKNGQGIIELIDKRTEHLSSEVQGLLDRLGTFCVDSMDGHNHDRIVLVAATDNPLSETGEGLIDTLTKEGRQRLGPVFDVEAISIKTIFLNVVEDSNPEKSRLVIPFSATLSSSDHNLLVGSAKLSDLHWFLRTYRLKTGDLDQLFEKNVRRFLGSSGRINRAIQKTLQEEPAQFGLFNNGITLVVEDFQKKASDLYDLVDPYIVNGCQTTRTLWEVFRQQDETGPRGQTAISKSWRQKIDHGVVVVKVVRVGNSSEQLLRDITRFTNSQNAVNEADFLTLTNGFQSLKAELARAYDIFLEVQRGGWDSQRALQAQKPSAHQFTKWVNAFELIKVYGAGWLREAGLAFGRNDPFFPGGDVYQKVFDKDREEKPFGADDLYALYLLKEAGSQENFGRGARKSTRRQSRYLFYLVAMDLLRDVVIKAGLPASPSHLTRAVITLARNNAQHAFECWIDCAASATDEYLTPGEDDSIFNEPGFKTEFNGNLNNYLKFEGLGKSDKSPRFADLIGINKRTMGRGHPSPRDVITAAIT